MIFRHRSSFEKEVAKETNDEEIFERIYDRCYFKRALDNGSLNLPLRINLQALRKYRHSFSRDGAFPLGEHLIKTYSRKQLSIEERIYNYSDRVADNIVKAISCLHNYLIDERSGNHLAGVDTGLANEDNGLCRRELQQPLQQGQLGRRGANQTSAEVNLIRENSVSFGCDEGSVGWQNE
uniref:Uncharacterized protein n=1 Tax=Ditylenchus dipsaci TaxID=166011 RepID=A0A915DWK6_9BILA